MSGYLVKRFLEEQGNKNFTCPTALEDAFNLPKVDCFNTAKPLRDTNIYSKPTHTVQRASILLNKELKVIDNDLLIANISEIIKNREMALG